MRLKRLSASVVLVVSATTAYGQISTTICEIVARPSDFHGQIVRVRAMQVHDFEISVIRDSDPRCSAAIWLDSKPGLLTGMHNAATMTGLVEYAGTGPGFGHLNQYPIRFELQSVSDPFDATGFLSGQVYGPDGSAVANVEVNAKAPPDYSGALFSWASSIGFRTCTDKAGRFTMTLPPGNYLVGANAEGAATPDVPFFPAYAPQGDILIKNQERKELSLTLGEPRPLREIPVKVVWPNGSPAKNVEIAVGVEAFGNLGPEQGKTNDAGTLKVTGFADVAQVARAQIRRPKGKSYCAKVNIPMPGSLQGNLLMKLTKERKSSCAMQDMALSYSSLFHPCFFTEKEK